MPPIFEPMPHPCPQNEAHGRLRLTEADARRAFVLSVSWPNRIQLISTDIEIWRRRRDSNPRYGNPPYGGLANRWFQPLTHVSGCGLRAAAYIGGPRQVQLARTPINISRRIDSPGSSTRIPKSGHSPSGALSAALACVTGSATKISPLTGE